MTNELILGCALVKAFTHRFIKGFRVGLQMPCLLAVEGSKQPQVSALPEWRVKKLRQTALWDILGARKGSTFYGSTRGDGADSAAFGHGWRGA